MPTSEDLYYLDLLTESGWFPARGDQGWYIGEEYNVPDIVEVYDVDYLEGTIYILSRGDEKSTYKIHPEDFCYREPEPLEDY